MAARVEIVPVTGGHIVDLAVRMRGADAAEVLASSGSTPLEAVSSSVLRSVESWAVLFDGELACIFGVCEASDSTVMSRRGWAWMLTAGTVEKHKRAFWTCCWDILPALLGRWDILANAIDSRHTVALRWGARLGFQFRAPIPWGEFGIPFHPFTVTKEDVICAKELS